MNVFNMDCIAGMRMFPDNTFDAVVTDPPYELGFMGKAWDSTGIAFNPDTWREALRVLKPGGHLLAFSGSRTYHRMACAIEDAGFDIRDQIMWVYGSGFPKSLDVSKAIDKAAGAEREVIAERNRGDGRPHVDDQSGGKAYRFAKDFDITAPATNAARQWEGWGTALKPAHEPIVVARKPLIGTVAENVLQHGTGALNIDGCRVDGGAKKWEIPRGGIWQTGSTPATQLVDNPLGRWPANVIHDGSDEVLTAFPHTSSGKMKAGTVRATRKGNCYSGDMPKETENDTYGDAGTAARFFYCAKASKRDRDEGLENFAPLTTGDGRAVAADNAYQRGKTLRANTHPTVKPTELMRYLCRLVTPPGGCILDPFAGSGSTGKAAALEGFAFIGFELDSQYVEIANARIKAVQNERI